VDQEYDITPTDDDLTPPPRPESTAPGTPAEPPTWAAASPGASPPTASPSAPPATTRVRLGEAEERPGSSAPPPPLPRGGGRAPWRGLSPRVRRAVRWLLPPALTILVGIGTGIAVAAAIHMPRVDSLADFTPSRITQLRDRQGKVFASYARQRRIVLTQDEIPDLMRDALIAVEDSNFYHHGGLDALGILRAALANLREGRNVEGASTLTMQLARQLFLSPEKVWSRKVQETLLAVELEKTYSKEQLLTLYLNFMFLGHNQYGVEAASGYYFDKSVNDLTIAEAATLAGIFQRPSKLSPYRAAAAVLARRNHVLDRMLAEGFISREEHAAAVATPLTVVDHRPKSEVGSYFSEEVRRYLESTYGTSILLERGLQVETTLDTEIQLSAEEGLRLGLLRLDHVRGFRGAPARVAGEPETEKLESWEAGRAMGGGWFEGIVLESNRTSALVRVEDNIYTLTPQGIAWTGKRGPGDLLKRGDVAWFRLEQAEAASKEDGAPPPEPLLILEQEPRLQGAAVVLESASGAVRAMVGGWDFGSNQFNRATQARRQVGSAFKMFIYGAALEAGFTPADTLFDAPVFFPGADNRLSYSPKNYYPTYYGITTLAEGLERSFNVTAVKLLDLVGVDRVIDFAHRAGVESELPPYPSLALGSADLSPLELAAAYASIANQGTYIRPYLIESVRTPEGQAMETHVPETRTVTSPDLAYVLTTMLEGVVDRGTARRLADLDVDLAGKTGTTNDYSNAWFVGFTPRYTMLVWVGYDQPKSMGRGMAGDKVAVPIWRAIAEDGLAKGWIVRGEKFIPPPGVTTIQVDYATGFLAGSASPRPVPATVRTGSEPLREYTPDWAAIMALPWYQQRPFYTPKEGERMPEHFRAEDVVEEEDGG